MKFHIAWDFIETLPAKVECITLYIKQKACSTSLRLPWLQTSEETVVKQFVQYSFNGCGLSSVTDGEVVEIRGVWF